MSAVDGVGQVASATTADTEVGYHGQPILKEPVWTWEIPLYFFVGGMAGALGGPGLRHAPAGR